MDGVVITKRADIPEGAIFDGSDGRTYLLKPVNRTYKAKGPTHYLEVLDGKRSTYLSGLFPIQGEPGSFSLDIKDLLGVRQMFVLRLNRDGSEGAFARRHGRG